MERMEFEGGGFSRERGGGFGMCKGGNETKVVVGSEMQSKLGVIKGISFTIEDDNLHQ